MIKKLIFFSISFSTLILSCTYENEEEAYTITDTSNSQKNTLDSGLVAYYKFEKNLTDSSTNNLLLSFQGSTSFKTDGYKGSALELNGSSYFSCTAGIHDTITICFWLKNPDELKNLPDANSSPTILDYGSGNIKFQLECDAVSGATYVSLTSGGDNTFFNGSEEWVNAFENWNFVVIEIVDKQIPQFYFFDSKNDHKFKTQVGSVSLQEGILIFGKNSGTPENYYKGAIDELRIYSRSLSKLEINTLN